MGIKRNLVGWFELPVTDMARATKFYESVFQIAIEHQKMGVLEMGWFPSGKDQTGASGSLVLHSEFYRPSATHGALVYFTTGDVSQTLERVVQAGGKVLQDKKAIGEGYGFMGLFLDSEGNRVALHSLA